MAEQSAAPAEATASPEVAKAGQQANILASMIPAQAQATQQEISNFINTGSTDSPSQILSGLFDINAKATSEFVTQMSNVPQSIGQAAGAGDQVLANAYGVVAANQRAQANNQQQEQTANVVSPWAHVAARLESVSQIPPGKQSIPALTRAASGAYAEVAATGADQIQKNAEAFDNLFSQIAPIQQQINSLQSARSKSNAAALDSALGPQYNDAVQKATSEAVRLHSESATLNDRAIQARDSGNTLSYIWNKMKSESRAIEAKQADADAQGLFATTQQAIQTFTMKNAAEFDPNLSAAQSSLANIKDQMLFLREKGQMTTQTIDLFQKAADAASKVASGEMSLAEFQNKEKMTALEITRIHGAIAGQAISNANGKLEYAQRSAQFNDYKDNKAAIDAIAHKAGFSNGSEFNASLQLLPPERRAVLADAATQSFINSEPKLNMKTYLDRLPPNQRGAAMQELATVMKDPSAKTGIKMMTTSRDSAAAVVDKFLAVGPGGKFPPGTTKQDKNYADSFFAAKGDKKQQALIKDQWVAEKSASALSDPAFRNQFPEQLGFKNFTAMAPAYLTASKVNPILVKYLPQLKNRQDEVSASIELQKVLQASGEKSDEKIYRDVAQLFKVYSQHQYSQLSPGSYGLSTPTTYAVSSDKVPSVHLFGPNTNEEQSFDMVNPADQARIGSSIKRPAVRSTSLGQSTWGN